MTLTHENFIINRECDWKNSGILQKFDFKDDRMFMSTADGKNAYFLSTSFDSGEAETVWNRLRLKAVLPKNASIRFSFYASDSLQASIYVTARDKKLINLDEYIRDESIPVSERVHLLKKFTRTVYFDNCDDILLYSLKGRYLWVSMEVESYSFDELYIDSLKIEFPMDSLVKYLPELYSCDLPPDSFLSRFVGVFQSVDNEINDQIENMPALFDPMQVDSDFLNWIASWFSIGDRFIWKEDKLRSLVSNMARLYKIKGTKQSIREVVRLYTGYDATVVEQFELRNTDFYANNREFVGSLFGENGYTFTVIVNAKGDFSSDEYLALLRLINLFKPMNSICNLVILNASIYLDYHCYLGINSSVSFNTRMVLNSSSVMSDALFLSE